MTAITAQNGRFPASALTATRTGQRLRHNAAGSYARLDAHMRAAGQGALTMSTGLSGYRTLAEQQHMRNIGLTTIAVGRSPHGEGLAADWQGLGGLNGARYRWLRNNAGPFGWFHPAWAQAGGVNPSAHHWEYDARRDTGAGSGGGRDDMPSAEEVARAVWDSVIGIPGGGTDHARNWLVVSRQAPELNNKLDAVGGTVWQHILQSPAGSDHATNWLTVARRAPEVNDKLDQIIDALPDHEHEHPRPRLHPADIEKIAVAVVHLLSTTGGYDDDEESGDDI